MDTNPYSKKFWLISETLESVVLLCVAYLFFVVGKYLKSLENGEIQVLRTLLKVCFVSVVLLTAKLVSTQIVAFYSWQSQTGCSSFLAISTALHVMTSVSVYAVFWILQNSYYDRHFRYIMSEAAVIASQVSFSFLLLAVVILTILVAIPDALGGIYEIAETGCNVFHQNESQFVAILFIFILLFVKLLLLGFLGYPILKIKDCARILEKKIKNLKANSIYTPNRRDSEQRAIELFQMYTPPASPPVDITAAAAHDCKEIDENVTEDDQVFSTNEHDIGEPLTIPPRTRFPGTPVMYYRKGESSSEITHYEKSGSLKRIVSNKGRKGSSSSIIERRRNSNIRANRKTLQQDRKRLNLLHKRIWKIFLLACSCVSFDTVFLIFRLALDAPELINLALTDLNLVINIICALLTFHDWQNIIFPLHSRCITRKYRWYRRSFNTSSYSTARHQMIEEVQENEDAVSQCSDWSGQTGSFTFTQTHSPNLDLEQHSRMPILAIIEHDENRR